MPIYEYRCNVCRKRFSALVGVVANASPPACTRCGATDFSKLMSRFSSPRSEDARLESLGDPSQLESMDDPKAMRRWMQEIGREMGEGGDEMDELMEEAIEEESRGDSGVDEAAAD